LCLENARAEFQAESAERLENFDGRGGCLSQRWLLTFLNMAEPASPEDHEAAGRYLTAKELCHDLAWEHATLDSRVHPWEIALALHCRRFGATRVAWILARRLVAARARRARHLKAIALRLRALPQRRRSVSQQEFAQKAKEELLKSRRTAICWERDLLAVYHDPSFSLGRRRAARQELEELRGYWEEQDQRQFTEFVALSLSGPTERLSMSQEWMSRFKRDGREDFFDWLNTVIGDYVASSLRGETWPAQTTGTTMPELMSLDQLLALEWGHDKAALWRFIEACLHRWEECDDPEGNHLLDLILHNVFELCPQEKTIRVAAYFKETKLVRAQANGKDLSTERADALLRKRSSRSIRNAKAAGFRVTRPARI